VFFSLIKDQKTDIILAEAEVIKVACEIMTEFSSFIKSYFIQISHSDLLQTIFDVCDVEKDEETRYSVSKIIGNLGREPWSTIKTHSLTHSLTHSFIHSFKSQFNQTLFISRRQKRERERESGRISQSSDCLTSFMFCSVFGF
jgi:histidyl-tRNA synthetase